MFPDAPLAPTFLGSEQGEVKDRLFLSTERYRFCVLEYDEETGMLPASAPAARLVFWAKRERGS
jgi:hypothetical protein